MVEITPEVLQEINYIIQYLIKINHPKHTYKNIDNGCAKLCYFPLKDDSPNPSWIKKVTSEPVRQRPTGKIYKNNL